MDDRNGGVAGSEEGYRSRESGTVTSRPVSSLPGRACAPDCRVRRRVRRRAVFGASFPDVAV